MGAVAYKLDLPPSSKIHPVVHVSVLKKAVATNTQVCPDLPDVCFDSDIAAQPAAVLQSRLLKLANGTHPQVLVKWKGLPDHMATWEALGDMQQQFPDALSWGQDSSQGEGYVTTKAPLDGQDPADRKTEPLRRSTRTRRPTCKD